MRRGQLLLRPGQARWRVVTADSLPRISSPGLQTRRRPRSWRRRSRRRARMRRPSQRRSPTPGSLSLLCWIPGTAPGLEKLPTPQVSRWPPPHPPPGPFPFSLQPQEFAPPPPQLICLGRPAFFKNLKVEGSCCQLE